MLIPGDFHQVMLVVGFQSRLTVSRVAAILRFNVQVLLLISLFLLLVVIDGE